MATDSGSALISAKGTMYFINSAQGLMQGYDLTLWNAGAARQELLTVKWAGEEFTCGEVDVRQGEATVRVYLPDLRDSVELTFQLSGCRDGLTVSHRPMRHWSVHIIQFAHHDLGYTDLPSNVLREFCDFYDDVLRFCSETDHFPEESKFRYTIEQGWSLLYYLEHRPEVVCAEMMRRIREERIEVNAFVGNETTELLGPEEMVRMLYPVFELKRKYGIPVVAAEHNDIPGFSWGVAAAMVGAGLRYFAPALPDYFRWDKDYHTFWDEDKVAPHGIPSVFNWEAPDGEKVLCWYGRQGACGDVDVTLSGLAPWLERLENSPYRYDVFRYLTLGGMRDNAPPRVEFAYSCREWNAKWAYPKLIQSLNSRFFPAIEQQATDIPTYRGELPGTDYSCAASCTAYPSSLNRVTHDQLIAAERIATIASEVTKPRYEYPGDAIDEAYYCELMNDEHAWGLAYPSGPAQEACIAQHCEFAYRAAALAQDVLLKSMNILADGVRRDEDCYYSLVFNPLSRVRTDAVIQPARPLQPCALVMHRLGPHDTRWQGRPRPLWNDPLVGRGMYTMASEMVEAGLEVTDVATGKVVPHEIYELPSPLAPVPYAPYRYAMGAYDRKERLEIRFVAEDVPALGYRLYKIRPAPARAVASGVRVGGNTLENRFYRLELDARTGAICSLFDKDLERELIDRGAEYGANQMVIRSSETSEVCTSREVAIAPGVRGPLSGSLIVTTSATGFPQVTQEIVLHADIKRIDIGNRVLKDSVPQLETFFAFPFAFENPEFRYEGSLCVIEPLVDQFPGSNTEYYAIQHWADVYDDRCGVTISSLDAPMMQFGANWPLYISQAHHGITQPNFDHPFHTPQDVSKGHIYSLVLLNNYRTNFSPTQNGDLLFRYSVTSHAGDWRTGRAADFGYGVSFPMLATLLHGQCPASAPAVSGFASIDRDNVVLLTLKRAEDGIGFIVRLLETCGNDTDVSVSLPFLAISQAFETDLVEDNQRIAVTTGSTVKVRVKAWATATIRVLVD